MTAARMADRMIPDTGGEQPPGDVMDRVNRGMARLHELAPERNECWEFYRNNTYAYRTAENQLTQLATQPSTRGWGGKPNHRVRQRRPIHFPIIRQEVAYATSRIPGYECNPSNTDPKVQNAARISSKVALFGYDKWRIKRVAEKVVTMALVADMGFAWPYWDSTVGPKVGVDQATERDLHQGEISVRTYSSNQVMWEPGLDFEDSRWYIVVRAEPIEQVKERPGYLPGDLTPDATNRSVLGKAMPMKNNLVLVIEYLERPCARYSRGRRYCIANGRLISRRMDYPLEGPNREVLDEPVLHKLHFMIDPENDSELGLMKYLLDTVRTYQNAVNKQIEWMNIAMMPQMFIKPGVEIQRTDEPGAVWKVSDPNSIVWAPNPPAPALLSEMQDRAKADAGFFSSQNDIPSQVEAARAIQALLERDDGARSAWISNVAEWHGRLMRHCLALVARHYTEGRLIRINGWSGPEVIEDFKGADLLDQIDVIVLPGSLQPRTRAYNEQKIMNYAQLGWIAPHQAMAAIDGGTAEGLARSYELDIARANRIIQQLFTDPEGIMSAESVPITIPDPTTGVDMTMDVPFWMPRKGVDHIPVWKTQFADAMKTERFEQAGQEVKGMFDMVWSTLQELEQQEAMEQMQATLSQAEGQGMQNASKQQTETMPSLPGLSGPGGQPDPAMGQQ